eukprot:GHVN01086028.1.p1 GENE.GHVN01086028.1~~GHVN01086028.1.p1  ORF type:complete len:329 (+),score=83.32 GHVN01086028.1:600-1586(+)
MWGEMMEWIRPLIDCSTLCDPKTETPNLSEVPQSDVDAGEVRETGHRKQRHDTGERSFAETHKLCRVKSPRTPINGKKWVTDLPVLSFNLRDTMGVVDGRDTGTYRIPLGKLVVDKDGRPVWSNEGAAHKDNELFLCVTPSSPLTTNKQQSHSPYSPSQRAESNQRHQRVEGELVDRAGVRQLTGVCGVSLNPTDASVLRQAIHLGLLVLEQGPVVNDMAQGRLGLIDTHNWGERSEEYCSPITQCRGSERYDPPSNRCLPPLCSQWIFKQFNEHTGECEWSRGLLPYTLGVILFVFVSDLFSIQLKSSLVSHSDNHENQNTMTQPSN